MDPNTAASLLPTKPDTSLLTGTASAAPFPARAFPNSGSAPASAPASALVFIDTSIADYQQLLNGLGAAAGNSPEIIFLDASQNGIHQITSVLQHRQDLTAIHVISHGGPGSLSLGNAQLDAETLGQYSSDLQTWGAALNDTADILFYGCNVGAGTMGSAFVDALAAETGADIAASTDLTGSKALGGDWAFELQTGQIETGVVFGEEAIAQYAHTFADFSAAQANAIKSGFSNLRDFGNSLDDFGQFAATLPLLGDTVTGAQQLGNTLDIGGIFNQLETAVTTYLDGDDDPLTSGGLASAVQSALDGQTIGDLSFGQLTVTDIADPVDGDGDATELLLQVSLQASRTTNLPVNLATEFADLGLTIGDADFDLASSLNFTFDFGLDVGTTAFFLRNIVVSDKRQTAAKWER